MPPRATRLSDGRIELSGLDPWLVETLRAVPALLDGDQPEQVSRRLYPLPTKDLEETREWERLVHPDLFALLADARRVLQRDLDELEIDPDPTCGSRIALRPVHVAAWLSALNAARLALAETHGLCQADMDRTELVVRDARTLALARVHMLGWLQELLIEASEPDWGTE